MIIDKIEKELSVKLPISYCLFHKLEKDTIHQLRKKEPYNSIYLATDENWIIKTNIMLGLPKSNGMMHGKFCIGEDGCGSYFLISLDSRDKTIYSTEHDAYEWEEIFNAEKDDLNWNHKGLQVAKNLKEFVIHFLTLE